MDFSLRHLRHQLTETFKSGVPVVPEEIKKLRIPFWGWAAPLVFLLALWAHRGSQSEGRIEWLQSHSPSPATWQSILSQKGYGPVEDPDWKEKAYAEMPEASRLKTSAYISENRSMIAVRVVGDWVYFRFGSSGKATVGGQVVNRELWEPLGIGWEAVAKIDELDLPQLAISAKAEIGSSEWRDPRRLDF